MSLPFCADVLPNLEVIQRYVKDIIGMQRQPCAGDDGDQGVTVASDLERLGPDPFQDPA
ncbi:MAG TPA: hypothetical protein VNW89_10635 [Stellaceae bacterium]|nr:hypothetical protein [Stellaceae bacterium]